MSQTGPVEHASPGRLRVVADLGAREVERRIGEVLERELVQGGAAQETLRRALYLKTSIDPRRQQLAVQVFRAADTGYRVTVAFEGPPRGSRGLLMHGTVEAEVTLEGEVLLGRNEISFRVVDERQLPAPIPPPRHGLTLVPPPPAEEPAPARLATVTPLPLPSRTRRLWKAFLSFLGA